MPPSTPTFTCGRSRVNTARELMPVPRAARALHKRTARCYLSRMSLAGAYRTEDGTILPAITTEEMRELDVIATDETGPVLLQMMENAGRNLAEVILAELPEDGTDAAIVVLAGTGGNGGGGICAARHLANRGLDVTLCVSRPEDLQEVPARQRMIYGNTSGAVVDVENLASLGADVVVDAIIGYSLQEAPHGPEADMIQWACDQRARSDARIVSLDVPSGVDATTGDAPGSVVHAHTTLTLALPKTGLHPSTSADAEMIGTVKLGDIGLPSGLYARFGSPVPFVHSFVVELEAVAEEVASA